MTMADNTEQYTIEDYLRGCVGFDVSDDMLKTVLTKRGIAPGTPVSSLVERDLDLAEAELLYRGITIPSIKGSVEDADGQWKHKEGQTEFYATDKKAMLQRANELRLKWGEDKYGKSVMQITSTGMETRRRCGWIR